MNKTIYLFIDTQAHRSIQFNLNHHSMNTILSGVNSKDVIVLTTSILDREIVSNCGQYINEERDKVSREGVLDSFISRDLNKVREKIKNITGDNYIQMFNRKFKPQSIDKDIDWRIVFDNYFNKKPPFSQKKKEEFPDAFNIEMLKDYIKKNLHVVSGDNDLYEWASKETGVTSYRSVKDFSDYFIKSVKPYQPYVKVYKKVNKQIDAQIIEHITDNFSDDGYYDVDSYHSEIELANVSDVQVVSKNILAINEDEKSLELEYRAIATIDLDISSDVVVYDSIDKEDIRLGSNSNTGSIDAQLIGKLIINFDEGLKKIDEFVFEDEDINADTFEVPHEWESFLNE